jgi:hypothetical protein
MSRHSRRSRYPHPAPTSRPGRPAARSPQRAPDAAPATDGLVESGEAAKRIERAAAPELAATGELAPAQTAETRSAPADRVSPPPDEGERAHLRQAQAAEAVARGSDDRPAAGHAPSELPAPSPGHPSDGRATCTVPQLRRFIKSRPWVPMHELRRRFGINGIEDDVTPIVVGPLRLYIGLPAAEGQLIAELLSGGDVGYELSMDPTVPIVVGVYPMRPVPRS